MAKRTLDEVFSNDPLGLLEVSVTKSKKLSNYAIYYDTFEELIDVAEYTIVVVEDSCAAATAAVVGMVVLMAAGAPQAAPPAKAPAEGTPPEGTSTEVVGTIESSPESARLVVIGSGAAGLTLALASVVIFLMLEIVPGYPARLLLGIDGEGKPQSSHASLTIAGTEGMVVSYAKCCYPLPGDDVMGYLTAGRGIVIHRNNCGNLSNFRKQPDKWIAVSWEKDIERDFHCQIQCETRNRTGVLAEVAATIADSGSNIEQVAVISRHEDVSVLTFLLQVHDRVHLAKILRNVRKMPSVIKVSRTIA